MITPERTHDQRMDALEKANDVRFHRACLKREMKAGRLSVLDLMEDPMCDTMKVWDALIAVPKKGRVKVNRTLLCCRISPSKTIGGLSQRQRYELVRNLGE